MAINRKSFFDSTLMLDEDKNEIIKTIDLIESSLTEFQIKNSNFLSPSVYNIIKDKIFVDDFIIDYFGGHSKAERRIISIRPFYEEFLIENLSITCIEIKYNIKFSKITHRDILGSLMSLGIRRDMVGDIYVHEDFAHIVIDKSLYEYIKLNLVKIRKSPIEINEIDFKDILYKENLYKTEMVLVSSNRLDSIISKSYKIDRKLSKELVSNNMVKINHRVVNKVHLELKDQDLISVKGYGRIIFNEILGVTRKDKLKVEIKILL